MSDAVDTVLANLAAVTTPTDAEREAMWLAVAELIERTEAAIADLGIEATVLHVGSTARGTWLSGDRDIDIFVRFPNGTDREKLTDGGLSVGRAVLDDGKANYAEHPYIAGTYDEFDVDIVPCVAVEDASLAETAVDRTPFHNEYVGDRLDEELTIDVRIAKHLLTNIDAYGSNLRTCGFGGYLLELLILEHDGIRPLLEEIVDWQPPVQYDLKDHAASSFDDPLVVIDPTDPNRNVAAVTAASQLARVQHYARAFLDEPASDTFTLPVRSPLSDAELIDEIETRGGELIALIFDRPDLVDDQLWPQLRKTRAGISGELDRRGFDVLRTATLATDNRLALLFECAVPKLSRIERHEGPPLAFKAHAERFLETYRGEEAVYGPFIEGDRYVIERERTIRTPRAFLASDRLFDVRIGDQLEPVLESGYDVLIDEDLIELLPSFGEELSAYFEPIP